MKLLLLGGSKFVGRHLVGHALERGHDVTTFTRGRTNPGLFDGVEELHGDRDGDLRALAGGRWDAAIDTSGYFPRIVRQSAELLRDRVDHYTFVSSVSVYANLSRGASEESPVGTLEDESVEEFGADGEYYGPLKALCEQVVQQNYGDRGLIVRPGLIVGPHDPTDRFTYWARRFAEGGRILAPAPPERRVQFIDVRDLSAWMLDLVEQRASGVFNATNEGVAWGELLAGADVAWAPDEFLTAHDVGEWMELPMWVADPKLAGIHETDVSRAIAAGLRFRPVDETIRDTAAWDATRDDRTDATATGVGGAGMARDRERGLLAALDAG